MTRFHLCCSVFIQAPNRKQLNQNVMTGLGFVCSCCQAHVTAEYFDFPNSKHILWSFWPLGALWSQAGRYKMQMSEYFKDVKKRNLKLSQTWRETHRKCLIIADKKAGKHQSETWNLQLVPGCRSLHLLYLLICSLSIRLLSNYQPTATGAEDNSCSPCFHFTQMISFVPIFSCIIHFVLPSSIVS